MLDAVYVSDIVSISDVVYLSSALYVENLLAKILQYSQECWNIFGILQVSYYHSNQVCVCPKK